jgi:hypothetical protein
MPLQLCKMPSHMPISKRVLTKKSFMSIIHRITIHRYIRYIRYNPGFDLSYSKPQFPPKGDISRGSGLLTKSWSSIL